ncbi:hypothetical protein BJX96DRAFT_157125 [Aspergillus floccosus]
MQPESPLSAPPSYTEIDTNTILVLRCIVCGARRSRSYHRCHKSNPDLYPSFGTCRICMSVQYSLRQQLQLEREREQPVRVRTIVELP